MVHSVNECEWGVQVKLWDSLRMRTIPEHLRVFTTRRYTNPRLPYLTLPDHSTTTSTSLNTIRSYTEYAHHQNTTLLSIAEAINTATLVHIYPLWLCCNHKQFLYYMRIQPVIHKQLHQTQVKHTLQNTFIQSTVACV